MSIWHRFHDDCLSKDPDTIKKWLKNPKIDPNFDGGVTFGELFENYYEKKSQRLLNNLKVLWSDFRVREYQCWLTFVRYKDCQDQKYNFFLKCLNDNVLGNYDLSKWKDYRAENQSLYLIGLFDGDSKEFL